MLFRPAQPALTGGDDQPETPCTRDVAQRLATKEVTGSYPPSPFDLAIDYQDSRGDKYRRAVSEARVMCAQCPIWRDCLRNNRDADGVIAGLTIYERTPRKPATERKGCGKPYGSSAHYKAGEESCERCKEAAAEATRRRRTKGHRPKGTPITHGTETGYSRHRKNGEEACESCKQAHRDHVNERAKLKREESAA